MRRFQRRFGHVVRRLTAIVVAAGVAPGCGAAPSPEPPPRGQLTEENVAAAVERRADALGECVDVAPLAASSRPLRVAIDVGRDGLVRRVYATGADAAPLDPATVACIRDRLATMRFVRSYEPVSTQVEVLATRQAFAGFLSPEQVERVVQSHARSIRYCYERQLAEDPELAGRVTVTWMITLDGSVGETKVTENTMGCPTVEACVLEEVGQMRFDQPDGGIVIVTYPFTFRTEPG